MRILFILEYYDPHIGGVETLFKQLVQKLASESHSVVVITNKFRNDLDSIEKYENLTIRRYRFYNRYLFTFLAWIPAIKYARHSDIIHTTSFNAAIPARIAAKICNRKSIITFHELWSDLWFRLPWMNPISRRLHYNFEKIISKFNFDQFVAVSNYTSKCLLKAGVKESKVSTIYNGIDYNSFKAYQHAGNKNTKYSFLFFGRISYSKGMDLLIEAIEILKKENINFAVKMLVPNEETHITQWFDEQLEKRGLESLIDLNYNLPSQELFKTISESDCVVIPSYSEGFCFAAVETMAIGTPIISSGNAALNEVISGKFIEMSEFSPLGLSSAMKKAIKNDWSYSQPRRFPITETINQYLKLYRSLLHSN